MEVRLSHDECMHLLSTVNVGHLGLNLRALPAVRTVNFTVDGDEVIVALRPGTQLAEAIAGNIVCVHADGDDWSVSVTGQTLVIDDRAYVAADMVSGVRHSAASLAQ